MVTNPPRVKLPKPAFLPLKKVGGFPRELIPTLQKLTLQKAGRLKMLALFYIDTPFSKFIRGDLKKFEAVKLKIFGGFTRGESPPTKTVTLWDAYIKSMGILLRFLI